jgi:hypothetical protein
MATAPFSSVQAQEHQEDWSWDLGVPVEYTNSNDMSPLRCDLAPVTVCRPKRNGSFYAVLAQSQGEMTSFRCGAVRFIFEGE